MNERFSPIEDDGFFEKKIKNQDPFELVCQDWMDCFPEEIDGLEDLNEKDRRDKIGEYIFRELMKEGRMTEDGEVVQDQTNNKNITVQELIDLKALEIFLTRKLTEEN